MKKGSHHTLESKIKIGLASKGRTVSEETKQKLSNFNKGKKLTEEHKAKIKTNHAKYWLGRKRPFRSLEWRKRNAINNTGEKSHWWKGGVDKANRPLRKKVMRTPEYSFWRDSVFKRDNYTCQICFTKGGTLNADHIKPFASYPRLKFTISNGRTLCEDCHRQTSTWGQHTEYQRSQTWAI